MQQIKQSSASFPLLFLLVDAHNHVTGMLGMTPTVTLSKNGGAFAACAGAVTELANGWYQVAANATDTNTLGALVLHADAGSSFVDPCDVVFQIVAHDPADGVRLGLTALPNAAASAANGLPTFGTGSGQINVAGGRADANVTYYGGAAGTFSGGIPAVNLIQWRGVQPNALTSGRVDSILGALASAVITAAGFATDALDSNALAASAATEIVNAVKAMVIETQGSYTLQQCLSIMLSVLAGITANSGATFKSPDGVATRVAATTDASDNRTAMTLTPSS